MPTAYTAGVMSGEITDLRTFALTCARQFGALVTMRDDPLDVPAPKRLEPSKYHLLQLGEVRRRLADMEGMGPDEIEAAAQEAYEAAAKEWEKSLERTQATRDRYSAMILKVEKWRPPTPDHEELKKFMLSQLRESLGFDCSYKPKPPKQLPPAEWHAEQIAMLVRDLARHAEEWGKEVKRTEERNRWLSALHESLPDAEGR